MNGRASVRETRNEEARLLQGNWGEVLEDMRGMHGVWKAKRWEGRGQGERKVEL